MTSLLKQAVVDALNGQHVDAALALVRDQGVGKEPGQRNLTE